METNFGRCSPRVNIGSTFFLIFINDLPNKLKSNAKLFADDTSLFTIVKDENKNANVLNKDLSLISEWAFNWKMLFNPDPTRPHQTSSRSVIFKKKENSVSSDIKPK